MTTTKQTGMTMHQPSKFWDKIAEGYAKKPVADEAAYQKKLQVMRDYFRAEMEILEFGSGTGSTAIALAPSVKHIQAIDISAKMIEIAKGKAEAGGVGNVTFEQSTIEDLDLPDGSLDAVMAHSILHLLESKEDAIAKVYRMLKPGGLFVSSTVCIGDFLKIFKIIAPVGRFFGLLPLVKVFTARELEDNLTSAGFTIDYRRKPGRAKGLFIVAKKAG